MLFSLLDSKSLSRVGNLLVIRELMYVGAVGLAYLSVEAREALGVTLQYAEFYWTNRADMSGAMGGWLQSVGNLYYVAQYAISGPVTQGAACMTHPGLSYPVEVSLQHLL